MGKHELGRIIGHGNFAKVKFAQNIETNLKVLSSGTKWLIWYHIICSLIVVLFVFVFTPWRGSEFLEIVQMQTCELCSWIWRFHCSINEFFIYNPDLCYINVFSFIILTEISRSLIFRSLDPVLGDTIYN